MEEGDRFTPEELVDQRKISSWNGKPVYLTTDCVNCGFHLPPGTDGTLLGTCEHGVAWKKLVERPLGIRACAKIGTESPRAERVLWNRSDHDAGTNSRARGLSVGGTDAFVWQRYKSSSSVKSKSSTF